MNGEWTFIFYKYVGFYTQHPQHNSSCSAQRLAYDWATEKLVEFIYKQKYGDMYEEK